MPDETITLEQYLHKRCNGHVSLRSLTRKEADILGIPYPLASGWPKKYRHVRIGLVDQSRLFDALGEYRKTKRAQKILRRAEGSGKLTIPPPPPPPQETVYRVPKHTFTEKPKQPKVTRLEQQAAAQKFFSSSMAYVATDAFLESFEWRKIRMHALKKYGARCMCCGATPQTGATMNVDHIKPRKLFPELALNIDNLQVLCHECNHGKGNWDMTDWRTKETVK